MPRWWLPWMPPSCTPAKREIGGTSVGNGLSSAVSFPTQLTASVVDNCGSPVANATVVASLDATVLHAREEGNWGDIRRERIEFCRIFPHATDGFGCGQLRIAGCQCHGGGFPGCHRPARPRRGKLGGHPSGTD